MRRTSPTIRPFHQESARFLGYDAQYFAAVGPQRRLAPHIHIAMRGTLSRTELRRVLAATYHQIWRPDTSTVRYHDDELPVWHEASGNYLDPSTGEVLPSWDQALDAIGPGDEPLHVAQFGQRFDAQGVIAGSRDTNRCIGYLTSYLTKHVADCHQATTPAQHEHANRLADALRYEPCSPTCANWLRHGVQPKNPRPRLRPGHCKGKAHHREHLGYAGRRVLVSASGAARHRPTTAPTAASGLRWSDIDLKAKTLTVSQARVLVEYRVRIEEPKSRNGKRTLPLDDELVAALTLLRKVQMEERAAAGTAYQAGLTDLGWYQGGEYVVTDERAYQSTPSGTPTSLGGCSSGLPCAGSPSTTQGTPP